MERLAQLLDDLDDLVSTILLLSERIRRYLLRVLMSMLALALVIGGILLALAQPPLALAFAVVLFVSLLYRTVTTAREPLEIA